VIWPEHWSEPEPAKFRSKGVGAIKRKWPAPEPESELRSFENLVPEQGPEPLKFSRLYQPWFLQLLSLLGILDKQQFNWQGIKESI